MASVVVSAARPCGRIRNVSFVSPCPRQTAPLSKDRWGCQASVMVARRNRAAHLSNTRMGPRASLPVTRRLFWQAALAGLTCSAAVPTVFATELFPNMLSKPQDLSARLSEPALPRPPPALFAPDLYYPESFLGTFNVSSMCVSVTCPVGERLFGRPGAFATAREEIGETLEYSSRFIRSSSGVIADRVYNVQAIATSAMGPSAVLECTQDSPNILATTLAPQGAGGDVFVVTLAALSRQQSSDTLGLYTCEMARQTVRLDTEDLRVAPAVKEIETTTLF